MYSHVIIHFENTHPFAIVEELGREIQASHWVSVQVTKYYNKLAHAGAMQQRCFLKRIVEKILDIFEQHSRVLKAS
ncbi:UNVERIFIED_CONTAM: Dolichyl-diphosphooligosaccharide--protein glycosyltransferase subunitB [Sesamum radiatum]|uniref:Dolichyl-diphosphooligosaccharide--protein glycosyltransferase subunit 1 n=1 Tax=Sesamum radiatum TaxID=300843 RepID=A0AAW2JWE2_SESRA